MAKNRLSSRVAGIFFANSASGRNENPKVLNNFRRGKLEDSGFREFGEYVRGKRMALYARDRTFSLRQVSIRMGMEPSYLSKVERGERAPLSEEKVISLADELSEDRDFLLAMAGKVAQEVQEVIRKRPRLMAQLLRLLKDAPDHAIVSIIREIRDGKW